MPYGYLGSMKTHPGHRDDVVAILLSGADGLRAAGCDLYVVGVADTDDVTIWVSEVWQSKDQHDASLQLPATRAAIARAMPMLTGESRSSSRSAPNSAVPRRRLGQEIVVFPHVLPGRRLPGDAVGAGSRIHAAMFGGGRPDGQAVSVVRPCDAVPVNVEFDAELWVWDARRDESWTFVSLPVDESEEIREVASGDRRGFGSVRVRATIGRSTWHTSIFPDAKRGSYVLPIKKSVRKAESLGAGDVAAVSIELMDY